MTQFLALIQSNDAPTCVHQVFVTLTNEHQDLATAASKLAISSLIKNGHSESALSLISCTDTSQIVTVTEQADIDKSELVVERIMMLYPESDLADGWIIESSDCIDMAFAIDDKDCADNQYHCYLTYHRDTNKFSGAFGYWTPNQGLPTDNQFSEFKSLYDLSEVERMFKIAFQETQFVTTAIPALADAVRNFMDKVKK
ncbi:hypothetical protein OTK49_21465 [Vibrio coralliirubri]|uniref:hypothetical protein n=1 Tax=Vibrio coralliirubri TaxID=1516159 RepID=UPI002283D616|nr:hypothetical protein [Vibrio coralliirubri]MCY9865091.1 hypothetical protein [Vibrio coralliirubri]